MNCSLLTKEELIRGEQIFRQLEKVREENPKIELVDLVSLLLCIKWGFVSDWKNSNIAGKAGIVVVFSPIIYILLYAFHIINC